MNLPKLNNVRPVLNRLLDLLDGKLDITESVAITSKGQLNLTLTKQGNTLIIKLLDGRPVLEVDKFIDIKSTILGFKLDENTLTIELNGLPDPKLEVES